MEMTNIGVFMSSQEDMPHEDDINHTVGVELMKDFNSRNVQA